jgi:protein involved in polysaccharide export with SLBB domain
MKLFVRTLFALSLLLAGLIFTGCDSFTQTSAPASNDIQTNIVAHFHVGETVNVTFSGTPTPPDPHEEVIKEDGNITLYLVGSIKAVGKTAGELQTEIHDLYVPQYYVRLTVTVKPGDLVYFVRGEVKAPGRQLYVGHTTVTQAITSASDFTDFANHDVWLIRANGERIEVDVDNVLAGKAVDPQVYPGDQIDVHRRLF